ncbi:OLC1v1019413C1 [Oldenlandia corymbosa var. corymbosa]|uniref:OLC1v1019413C1 n=1 Tax=Oldenlandia corymbosa var. corymbosa TaxID=529605 RepID=A0AAV1EDV4_OLDCO|nr:OLC1v1019413C1 [Oldenlandia corymbosa var. corymbosa]
METLVHCKLVCKSWRAIIQDDKFWKLYRQKDSNLVYIYMDLTKKNANNLSKDKFRLVCCVDGVFLEKCDLNGKLRLRNPVTKHSLPLPDGLGYKLMRMFYLPTTGNYKIVCGKTGGGFRLLTVGIDLHWRAIEADDKGVLFQTSKKEALLSLSDVKVDDVYFLIKPILDNIAPGSCFADVFCLEVETETLEYTRFPKTFSQAVEPFSWNHKLALADLEKGTELHLWILEDYKKSGKWSEMKILLPSTLFREFSWKLENLRPYSSSNVKDDPRLWFCRADHCVLEYNIKTGQEETTHVPPAGKSLLFSYFPTLSNLNGALIPPAEEEKWLRIKDGARNHVLSCFTELFALCGRFTY